MSMSDLKPYGSPKVYSTLLACIQCSNIVESSQLNNAMLCQQCRSAVKCKYCRKECKNKGPICSFCTSSLKTCKKPKNCEQCQMLCAFGKPKCARCLYNNHHFGEPLQCIHCKNRAAWEAKKVDNRLLCYPCAESYKKVLTKVSCKNKSTSDGNNNNNGANTNSGSKRERSDFTSNRLSTTNESSNGNVVSNGSAPKKSRNDSLKFLLSLSTSNSSLLSTSNILSTSTAASTDLLSSTDNLAEVSRLQERILSLEKQLQAKNSEILMRDVKITEIKAELSKEQKACREKILDCDKRNDDRLQEMQSKINILNKQIAGLTKKTKNALTNHQNHHHHHHHHPNVSSSRPVGSNRQRAVRRKQGAAHNRSNWATSTVSPSIVVSTTTVETMITVEPTRKIISSCSIEALESCLELIREVMQNNSLAYPTNVYELRNTCRKLKAGDYCAGRYILACVSEEQRSLYHDIVQGTKNVIRLICQQGDTQNEYFKFASCFKDISVSEQKCAPVMARFNRISDLISLNTDSKDAINDMPELKNIQSLSDDEKLIQFCCSYRDTVDCQTINVRRYCGEEGLEFFDRYTGEMTSSLIKKHCLGYTFGGRCIKAQPTSAPKDKHQLSLSSDTIPDNSRPQLLPTSILSISIMLLSSKLCFVLF